jgi:hypothetical protein
MRKDTGFHKRSWISILVADGSKGKYGSPVNEKESTKPLTRKMM